MARTHDMGGRPTGAPIDQRDHPLADWEILTDALNQALGSRGVKRTDESRRAREDLPAEEYLSLSYYERWVASMEIILIEKHVLTREELDAKMAALEVTWGNP